MTGRRVDGCPRAVLVIVLAFSAVESVAAESAAIEPAATDSSVVRKRCLGPMKPSAIVAISDSLVVFQGKGRYWLNRLARPCAGVKPNSSLVMIARSPSQSWCRGDVFTYGERLVMCPLGDFEEMTAVQIQMLRRAEAQ